MEASEFVERVRTANATALDRLGSEKAIVAATGAALDRETVLEAAAAAEARAVATFEAWADDEGDERAREAFAAAADSEQEHYDRVCDLGDLDDAAVDDPDPDALHAHLRDLEETVPRVGAGLVARPLVASRSLLQVINVFVNEGDAEAADLFRELRAESDDQVEAGAGVVVEVCAGDDVERSAAAADAAIQAAYDEYAETLEGLGIDPKPVC
jgi:hypothetical protein